MHTDTHLQTHTCMLTNPYSVTHMHIYISPHPFVYMCIDTHTETHIFMHTHTHKHRYSHRLRHRHRRRQKARKRGWTLKARSELHPYVLLARKAPLVPKAINYYGHRY